MGRHDTAFQFQRRHLKKLKIESVQQGGVGQMSRKGEPKSKKARCIGTKCREEFAES